jgi:DNA repair exonuclease SbcCD ATPase subunit
MYIKQITLTDWRAYASAVLSCAPLTVVRGANHSGKTSIAEAIQIALGGRSDTTDLKGAGASDNIRTGATKAEINLLLQGAKEEVELKVAYSNMTGRRSQNASSGPFLNWMEMQQERFRCVLSTDYFTSQKDRQKNILASLVLPTTAEYDPAMLELAMKHFQAAPNGVTPVAFLDNLYQLSFKARSEAKVALQAIYIPPQPPALAAPSEAVDEKLSTLRKKAEKLAKKAAPGGNDAAIARLTAQIEALEEKLKAADEELSELRPTLADVEADILPAPKLKDVTGTAGRRAFLNQLDEKARQLTAEREAQREVQQMFRDMLSDPSCPTCKQTISPEFIKGKIAEHKALEEAAGLAYNGLLEEKAGLGDVEGSEGALKAHAEAVARKQQLTQEIAKHHKIFSEASLDLPKRRNELDNLKTQAPAEDAPNAELEALHAEIAKWEGHLRSAITYEATLKQIEEATARRVAQQKTVDELEKLVAYSGKDGIKAKLIEENIAAFMGTVNSVLSAWSYSCALSFEPYAFTVTGNGRTLPVKQLSGSEAMFFGIALQCAIAVWSKIRMVVIDKADTLVGAERGRLFQTLDALITNGTLAQAIVMMSSEQLDVRERPGTAFYFAQGGTVRKLDAIAA